MRDIRLEFVCRHCGLEGVTPEVTPGEAMGLIRGELGLRCPACCAIVSTRTTEVGKAILARRLFLETVDTVVREYLTGVEKGG
jgi:hypothetical protein